MNIVAKDIGVDAGMIMVADMDYLKSCPSPDPNELHTSGKIFSVPNGKYIVRWNIANTYNGPIKGTNILVVTSGTIFVCDPCYVIGTVLHDDWMKWLDSTEYGKKLNSTSAFIIDEMGGDGEYNVRISLESVS